VRGEAGVHVFPVVDSHLTAEGVGQVAGTRVSWPLKVGWKEGREDLVEAAHSEVYCSSLRAVHTHIHFRISRLFEIIKMGHVSGHFTSAAPI